MDQTVFNQKFKTGLKGLKLKVEGYQLELYWKYLNFLLQENKKYNLTGITVPETIITKHFLDSLAIFPYVNFKKNPRVLDVGTGAGFPGLVLKIFFPDIKLVLLDSRLKRIHFLKILINELSKIHSNDILNEIEVIHDRAESLGQKREYRKSFDVVVSRAVAPVKVLSEFTLPFLKLGKTAVFYKGPDYNKELKAAVNALSILGGKIYKIEEVDIPGIKEKRFLIFIKKISKTPDSYPRREGIPKKRPL